MRSLTTERTAFFVLVLMLFAIATRVPADTDTWWHIRSGEYTLTQGMITGDPFSHSLAGQPWINHSWGSQIVMLGFYRLAGDAGLSIFQAILAVGGMLMLYRASSGSVYLRSFLLVLGASTAAVFWSARPQMFSFFFNALFMLILVDYKRGTADRLWWLVPLMWVWGNLHAGWSIGFIFMGAFLVGEAFNTLAGTGDPAAGWRGVRRILLVMIACVPVLLISPYGLDNLLVPINTVSIGPLRDYIQEWNSPNFQGRETWPFIGTVVLLFMALWIGKRPFDWSYFFLIGGTLFMALLYGRNVAVFAVAAVPVLALHLDGWLTARGYVLRSRTNPPPRLARLNALLLGVVAVGVGLYLLSVLMPATIDREQRRILPVDAVEFLNQQDYAGPMFNSYNWGGYLMLFAPQYPVFIDGRTDLYGDFLQTYLDAALGRDAWRETFRQYGIRLVFVEVNSGLDRVLRDEPGWNLAYEDEKAVIHVLEGDA